MNLRRKKPHDSLYMLLDTMCNAFGGIILMAVLVVVLTSREKNQGGAASDSPELLQRRITIAETALQKALQLQTSLQASINNGQWKSQVALLEKRQRLQDEIKATQSLASRNARELEESASADPAQAMKDLNAALAAARSKKTEAQNRAAVADDDVQKLAKRLEGLQQQAARLISESELHLRLPKEHATGKNAVYVIACNGRIYPCRNSDRSRNEADIDWTVTRGNEIARPKKSKGIDLNLRASDLIAYFREQSPESSYIVFCVFEDSFPAFIRAKAMATERGLSYGWEPFQSDGIVSFSETGHTPKPQ